RLRQTCSVSGPWKRRRRTLLGLAQRVGYARSTLSLTPICAPRASSGEVQPTGRRQDSFIYICVRLREFVPSVGNFGEFGSQAGDYGSVIAGVPEQRVCGVPEPSHRRCTMELGGQGYVQRSIGRTDLVSNSTLATCRLGLRLIHRRERI